MKRSTFIQLLLSVILSAWTGSVYPQFNISGEFRLRPEYRDGFQSIRDSSKIPYLSIPGRARLLFDYSNEKFSTRFSFQDAFIFGQNNYSSDTITKNTINIYEVWVKYNFMKSFSIQAGRVELVYDDHRLITNANWPMTGATHDLVLLHWNISGLNYKGDWGFAINNTAPSTTYLASYNLKNNYKYMTYFWEQKKFFNNKLTLSLFGLLDAFQKYSDNITKTKTTLDTLIIRNSNDSIIGTTILPVMTKTTSTVDYPEILYARGTIGFDGWFNLKKWGFFLTAYWQGGHARDGRRLNAYFLSGNASYQFIKQLKLTIAFDHFSGTDYSDTTHTKTTINGFSALYGSGHIFYGYMELFSSYVKNNASEGLNNLSVKANIALNEKLSLEAKYHWFSMAYGYIPMVNPNNGELSYTSVNKNLGSEVDLIFIYKPLQNVDVSAGYCFYFPTKAMEILSNLKPGTAKFAQFAYIQINYKPNFFNSGK